MKTYSYILFSLACLLSGCATVGRGIGGGGTVHAGASAKVISTSFADNLTASGFHVTKTSTNEVIYLVFSRGSTTGRARFEPEGTIDTGIPAGYSYSYSARDNGSPWFAGRRLNQVRRLIDKSK
jgi:hypothetical protein